MRPVILFTDFGLLGPYVGELRLAVHKVDAALPVFDLMHDAPRYAPGAAGLLLAAMLERLPQEAVVCAVIDPGVGTARRPVILHADDRWFVGPDNGLLDAVAAGANDAVWHSVDWRPENLSTSFHGRDLFAPVAARLAQGHPPPGQRIDAPQPVAPADPAQVIYLDDFGNAWTGLRAITDDARIHASNTVFPRADTFGDVPVGAPLWYVNSSGLVELAFNQDSAAARAGLAPETPVTVLTSAG